MYHRSKLLSGAGVVFLGSTMLFSCTNPHATQMDERASLGRGPDMLRRAHNEASSLLHMAVWREEPAVVDTLLNGGAEVNSRDHIGVTALHIAKETRKTAVVNILHNRGADVNSRDNEGVTALQIEAETGKSTVIQNNLIHITKYKRT